MIQSEYGWSDAALLDMPICRFRQILYVAQERISALRKHGEMVVDLQTRAIVAFIAGTVKVEKGKKNPLADAASKFKLFDDSLDPSKVQGQRVETDSSTKPEVFVVHGSQVADNAPGSVEALMSGFGSR